MNELFLQWLEIEKQVKQDSGSKQSYVFGNAIKSLRDSPAVYKHPRELAPLKYFGNSVIGMLTNKLKAWCKENGKVYEDYIEDSMSSSSSQSQKRKESQEGSTNDNDEEGQRPKKRVSRREYKPTFKSGGFGIVLALYLHDSNNYGLHKAEIVLHASKYSDSSFVSTNTAQKTYTAWSSMKTLLNNVLVEKLGNPPRYCLSDKGKEIGRALKLTWDAHTLEEGGNIEEATEVPARERIVRPKFDNSNNPVASSSNPNTANNSMLGNDMDVESSGLRGSMILSSPLNPNKHVQSDVTGPKRSFKGIDYDIWHGGSYDVVFMLDKREVAAKSDRARFYNDLRRNGVDVENRNLPVGDGAWVAIHKASRQEAILDHLFERKRLDDLVSSIKDNRFREQEGRLKKCGLKRIMYLVEEDCGLGVGEADKIKTAMTTMNTHLKATLVRTKNYEATVKYICEFDKVVANMYVSQPLLVIQPGNLDTQDQYLQILESMRSEFGKDYSVVYKYDIFDAMMQKKTSLRVKDVFVQCLKLVKGMSLDKAVMIQRKYKTPSGLLMAYDQYVGDKSLMIQQAFKDEVGSRKINQVVSTRVYETWCSLEYV